MKRFFFLIVLCLAAGSIAPVFAQQISKEHESEYYYVSIPLEKVYPYRKGYVVDYRTGIAGRGRAYLPQEWFSKAAGKGEVILMHSGAVWPHLTVYYKGGEFSHVRLYVRREMNHETWGNIPLNADIDAHFEGVDEIKLRF